MNTTFPPPFPWLPAMLRFCQDARAVAVGVFGLDGAAHYVNTGLLDLLESTLGPLSLADALLTPELDELTSPDVPCGLAYNGLVTFGGPHLPYRKLHGRIWRGADEVLIICEYDVDAYEDLDAQLRQRNEEIAQLRAQVRRLSQGEPPAA